MTKGEDFYSIKEDFGTIAILNGQQWLDDTEQQIFELLADSNQYPWVIDNLFEKPERLTSLKFLKPNTIIFGTTGTFKYKLDGLLKLFISLEWIPKNVIFTRGEDYFDEFLEMGIVGYKVYPYTFSMRKQGLEPPVVKLK